MIFLNNFDYIICNILDKYKLSEYNFYILSKNVKIMK